MDLPNYYLFFQRTVAFKKPFDFIEVKLIFLVINNFSIIIS